MYYNYINFNICCIRVMCQLLNHVVYFGWDNIVVSINGGAQVASFTHYNCI